eukprot:TRINITY_DN7937_c0_g1_i3.p1 TRINITY_DN7937_c0_g1~~TRINITY_DN7937_c0_g1_i3.p1  ORF type:complete len:343 (-),score=38.98 TRINITY_DN7937_c0_g1_i3:50-994(-)
MEPACFIPISKVNQALGWCTNGGILISFLPQIFTLLFRKDTTGLSGLSWATNSYSNLFTMFNAVLLNWDSIVCCRQLSSAKCLTQLIPEVQLAVPAVCVTTIYFMYVYYCVIPDPVEAERKKYYAFKYFAAFLDWLFENNAYIIGITVVFVACALITLAISAALVIFTGPTSHATIETAKVFGLIAVALLFVQYIPQIYTTQQLKCSGSLSIATLLLQAPGSLVVCYFQAIVSHGNWTTWLPYMVTAIQQLVLVLMILFYWFRRKYMYTQEQRDEEQRLILIQRSKYSGYSTINDTSIPVTSRPPSGDKTYLLN